MLTAIRSWQRGCGISLAKRIGETLGEEDWRRGLAGHLAKRIGEELGEGEGRGGGEEEKGERF